MAKKLIDVSKHNTVTDWKKVKESGIDAVIIRAGYGCIKDPKFDKHIKGAQAAGLAVGVYWFAYPFNAAGAVKEANCAHSVLKPYKLDLGVWYDFEYDTERYANQNGVTFTAKSRTEIIKAFCDRIKALGYETGIYLNPDYVKYRVKFAELKEYPLWLAAWKSTGTTSYGAVSYKVVPKTYGDVAVWQFGKGKVNGITGNVDINYIYIDIPEKVKYFKKPAYTGVSIVEALAKIGEKTTFAYRKKIAAANGIKNYSGTATQNTQMLNLLKRGKLIKP